MHTMKLSTLNKYYACDGAMSVIRRIAAGSKAPAGHLPLCTYTATKYGHLLYWNDYSWAGYKFLCGKIGRDFQATVTGIVRQTQQETGYRLNSRWVGCDPCFVPAHAKYLQAIARAFVRAYLKQRRR